MARREGTVHCHCQQAKLLFMRNTFKTTIIVIRLEEKLDIKIHCSPDPCDHDPVGASNDTRGVDALSTGNRHRPGWPEVRVLSIAVDTQLAVGDPISWGIVAVEAKGGDSSRCDLQTGQNRVFSSVK